MNKKLSKMLVIIPAGFLALSVTGPVFAQDSDATASDSMHSAAADVKAAASNTADAVKHTYRGAKTAAIDSQITAKVKMALHDNKSVGDADIHVKTDGGIVTLRGEVPSREAAANAEQVAQQTEGVKRVNNEMTVTAPGNAMR